LLTKIIFPFIKNSFLLWINCATTVLFQPFVGIRVIPSNPGYSICFEFKTRFSGLSFKWLFKLRISMVFPIFSN
jgi:hypothetical protein